MIGDQISIKRRICYISSHIIVKFVSHLVENFTLDLFKILYYIEFQNLVTRKKNMYIIID